MKRTIISLGCALFAIAASAQSFTVTAHIKGIEPNCKVELQAVKGYNHEKLVSGKTVKDGFTLTGTINNPVLVQLKIDDKPAYTQGEFPFDRGVQFLLASGETAITAASIDSVPLNYEMGNTPLHLERFVKVKGGVAQQHYQEWRDYIYPAELAAWQVGHVLWLNEFSDSRKPNKSLTPAMEQAKAAAENVVNEMNAAFCKQHPDYAISLILQENALGDCFRYTPSELDSLIARYAQNEDQAGYARLKQALTDYRRYAKGVAFNDFAVETPEGKAGQFSNYVEKGKYTLVDFWASWCGPCRMAIPNIKRLFDKLQGKFNIVSVSLDSSKPAWQKAMTEEAMPWKQALAPKPSMGTIKEAYRVDAIPYLMLIDADGKVVFSTHDAGEMTQLIAKLFS